MAHDQSRPQNSAPHWATWTLSLINGAAGDYLHARQNGLAVEMACYHQGHPLALTTAAILAAHPVPTTRLCLLVHGLGCHEGIWHYRTPEQPDQATTYGAQLQAEAGFTPFYVRYNTGLALAENGRRLAALIRALVACYPAPVEELLLIGHSMGGLVLRHACHVGATEGAAWVAKVTRIFYLGTPHAGAPLAQVGHAAATVLQAVPNPITRLIGGIFDLRSQGIKDLRVGARAGDEAAQQSALPWLPGASHYVLAGTLAGDSQALAAALWGDGLVPPPRNRPPGAATATTGDVAALPPSHIRCFPQMHHMQLAGSPAVYAQIQQWCDAT